jgi:glycosyltransferase involved in cell wall biosynthesis
MKISIITCTWNSEPFLAESIASVLGQTHTDVEYIFVDGGSTDGTLERIAAIPRAVTLIRDIRGGIANAMNVGLQAATGDIVAHLHSDDYYLKPTVLALVNESMETSHAGWCFGRIKRLIEGQLVPESYTPPAFSWEALFRGNFIPHPATFVRRDWMVSIGGFDLALRYAMDYDMWLKLAKKGPAIAIGKPLAAFREHDGSLSSSNRLAAMAEDQQVRLRHFSGSTVLFAPHVLRYWVRRRRMAALLADRK